MNKLSPHKAPGMITLFVDGFGVELPEAILQNTPWKDGDSVLHPDLSRQISKMEKQDKTNPARNLLSKILTTSHDFDDIKPGSTIFMGYHPDLCEIKARVLFHDKGSNTCLFRTFTNCPLDPGVQGILTRSPENHDAFLMKTTENQDYQVVYLINKPD